METRESILSDVSFMDFVLKYEPKLRSIAEMMSIPFGGTIAELEVQIGELSSKLEFLSWSFAFAEEFKSISMHRSLTPKRKDITDMDRNIALEYSTSKETLLRDWIEGMCDDADKYLSNAQSVLSTKRAELMAFRHE